MKVISVEVSALRAIDQASIELEPLTYLVGRNGVGKSTFLHAIAAFFNAVNIESADDWYRRRVERPIEISLTFGDLGPQAAGEFAAYVARDETLTVTKRYTFDGTRVHVEGYFSKRQRNPEFRAIRALSGRARTAAFNKIKDAYGFATARSQAEVLVRLDDWETQNPQALEPVMDEGRFFGYRNVAAGRLDKYIDFVLIPALRDPAIDAGGSRDSALRQLVTAVVRQRTDLDAQLRSLRERIVGEFNDLVSRPAYGLDDLTERVNVHFSGYAAGARLELTWGRLNDISMPDPLAEAVVGDDDFAGDVAMQGHGIQRAYLMAVLQALAGIGNGEGLEGHDGPSLLLAIEEPELYQHPAQARMIARALEDLTGDGSGGVQAVACTHSPYFIAVHRFSAIRRVRKVRRSGGVAVTVAQATLAEVGNALNAAGWTGASARPDDVEAWLAGQLTSDMSEAFFSEAAILVEGQEDRAIVAALLQGDSRWPASQMGTVSVVEGNGKGNLGRLAAVLRALDIPTFLVFDLDKATRAEKSECLKLLRVMGAHEPTTATLNGPNGANWAVMRPNMTRVLETDLGTGEWNRRMQEAAGALRMQRREKSPLLLSHAVAVAKREGTQLPVLDTLAESIINFAKENVV